MNPVFGRKRADEFDRLLSTSHAAPSSESYGDLLAVVTTLRTAAAQDPVQPRPDFSASLRAQLMTAAETALAPTPADADAARDTRPAPVVRRSPRERRLAAAVGGFAIVSATASMAVAAQSALPGDTLYPLKRAIENAQTGVQQEAEGKGVTLLDNATGRLAEVDALSRAGDDEVAAITSTLGDFVTQATAASDLLLGDYASTGEASSIAELRTFTADSMGALTTLQSLIPRDARASLIEATRVITAIDVQAQGICPTCTDLPIMEAPAFAAARIETLLDDALSPVLDPVLGSATDDDSRRREETRPRPPRGDSSAQPTPDAGSTPTDPTTPAVPEVAPGETESEEPRVAREPDGLLDNLNVKGSKDPIGDLLVGTGKSVDEVVEGVDETLDDLGTTLGDGLKDGLKDGLGGLSGGLGGLGRD